MIWLIGNKGMLGSDVEQMLIQSSYQYCASDLDVDITDNNALKKFIESNKIDWIINCSAYTAVDKAEDEKEKAFAINADGVYNIACIAQKTEASFIHISTDYVFDGEKDKAYCEDDMENPTSVYGRSKYEGEKNIKENCATYFIIRTAWLYGANGNNFVRTMIKLFNERDEVRVVDDQWGSPTFTKDVAGAVMSIIQQNSDKFGIYHFTNEGRTNWYEFACEIYARARKHGIVNRDVRIVPITTSEYPTKAIRPKNSYLSKEKIIRELGVSCRSWQDALEEFIGEMTAPHHKPTNSRLSS